MRIDFQYSRKAEKFFSTHEEIREEFKVDATKYVNNDHPETVDFKRLKGKMKGYNRIAIRGYRVIFRYIREKIILVDVIKAGARGDVYK